MSSTFAINGVVQNKIHRRFVVKAGKGITLSFQMKIWMILVKMIKLLENSGVLIDGVTKIVKHDIKRLVKGFLGMLLGTLGVSILGWNMLNGKGMVRARRGYKNIYHMHNFFSSAPSFKQYRDYYVIQTRP